MNKLILTFLLLLILPNLFGQNKKLNSEQIFQTCEKSVVTIYILKDKEYYPIASGVFISNSGYFVTNFHVFQGIIDADADYAFVKNNNKFEPLGKLVCWWQEADLAIFKIDPNKFQGIKIDENNTLKKGSKIYTISSPIGIENSITEGIVSNLEKPLEDYPNVYTKIFVDAKYTHGSSGGALINEYGELVGILQGGEETKDGARANINWAIPITFLNILIAKSDCNIDKSSFKKNVVKQETQIIEEKKETPKGLQENPGQVNIE
jgi:S1-C subfamily serine protease